MVPRDSLFASSFSSTFWVGKCDFSALNLSCLCSREVNREGESISLNGIVENNLASAVSYLG